MKKRITSAMVYTLVGLVMVVTPTLLILTACRIVEDYQEAKNRKPLECRKFELHIGPNFEKMMRFPLDEPVIIPEPETIDPDPRPLPPCV